MVAVSQDLKRFVCEQVGIDAGRVEVIYNGVSSAQTVTETEIRQCKSELGIAGKSPILGVVGSLYPVKGHRFLIAAMPEILRRWPDVVLLVIGRGKLEASLEAQAEELGVGAHVRFLGLRQDVPRLLSALDVFVLPSLSEGLSLALLEAMAAGKPVVATEVGGNPEVVIPGETGYLAKPEDTTDLTAKLTVLLESPLVMQQCARYGAQRALQFFSIEQMTAQYRVLYRKLLD
jgi:glycosyltransferase involved in cell wall biosynthesis